MVKIMAEHARVIKIERIDIPETPEEEEWLSKQDFHNGADQAYTG